MDEHESQITPSSKGIWGLSKRTWWFIGLAILALLLVLAYSRHHSSTTNSTTNKAASSTQALVSIIDSGFSPQTLSVKVGTMVTWTNKDSKTHEVAADPYPKNNSIPNFNNQDPLNTNDSYSFTFTKSGTYHYHDQLKPLSTPGTVIVK